MILYVPIRQANSVLLMECAFSLSTSVNMFSDMIKTLNPEFGTTGVQGANHVMATLPDDLLAKILTGVPLGKAKVRMQAVSRYARGAAIGCRFGTVSHDF